MKYLIAINLLLFFITTLCLSENYDLTNRLNTLKKYEPIQEAFSQITNNDGNCLAKSKKALELLEKQGIQGEIKYGETPTSINNPNECHAWIAIWFDATGQVTNNYQLTNNCK